MRVHNNLSRKLEEVKPIDGKTIRIYSCGPTVYDHIHIGNLSSFIFADTLRRAIKASGDEVKHVMNFTDVDDKTIGRSRERYPDLDPKEALLRLTSEYSEIFLKDMRAVGNDVDALQFVKATDTIEGMQELIRELYKSGFAYVADDGVYFSIEAYKKSGKIYGQLTEITSSSTSEARINNDEYDKESVHDFALWKKQKDDEPVWEFELDGQDLSGRPGWHIECSVMSSENLGQPFDIHTGGVDLVFPHHENEIAQSTAGQKDPIYAKVFAHNEHLLVDGQKMSKSLKNFYTLKDITDKGFDPLAFRLLVLQSHYKKQAHFTWNNLQAAQNRLNNWREAAAMLWQQEALPRTNDDISAPMFEDSLTKALADDLDTGKALQLIDEIAEKATNGSVCGACLDLIIDNIKASIGLDISVENISVEQAQLIEDRESARKAKEWQKSDDLRESLKEQGIGLRDTDHGAIWFRL